MMLRKNIMLLLLSVGTVLLTSFSTKDGFIQQPKSRLHKIVIDAGHGGKDSGAPGKYSYEKNIALAISLKLEELLKEQMPDVELVLTRRTDIYQHPTEKANIANAAKGDLFVCIHCNSADPTPHKEYIGTKTVTVGKGKRKHKVEKKEYRTYHTPNPAKGMETYIWGAHKNDDKEIAMRENQSLYLDSSLAKLVKDFNPNSVEQMQFTNLMTRKYFDRSAFLAQLVEDEYDKTGGQTRGALQRQKGIWVLQAVAMPAVLVETGYISNPEEEDYLNSKEGQEQIAQTIVNALKRYQYSLDNKLIGSGGTSATTNKK